MVLEQLVWSGSPSLGLLSGPCFPFRTCQATLGSRCSPIRLSDRTGLEETLTPCKPQVGRKICLTPTSLSQGSIFHTQGESQASTSGNAHLCFLVIILPFMSGCSFRSCTPGALAFLSVTPGYGVMGYTRRAVRDTDCSLDWLGLFIIPVLTILSYSHGGRTTYNVST